ncbi:MAG TPA: exopolyphosphatase [Vicinamibacteria bacterium]|nr:exopolyphosphatase [Vicinamibacteria bacterium]
MRLVTRADLDGLACAVLMTASEKIDEILLVHPQDITDKKIPINLNDILANLPYHPSCGKWFDHHLLTESNERPPEKFEGRYGLAPSAARVVFEYYIEKNPFLRKYEHFIAETDRLDSAQLNIEDVLEPKDYILLGYTLDPRTGLGAYQDYFKKLVEWLHSKPIEEIMEIPEVKARVDRIHEQDKAFREATLAHSRLDGNVLITDFRGLSQLPVGNRFLVYTLFPQANISMRVHWGPSHEHVSVAVGHSIFNRTSRTTVGNLMSHYGGGGHKGAGHCLLPAASAEAKIVEMIATMKKDG